MDLWAAWDTGGPITWARLSARSETLDAQLGSADSEQQRVSQSAPTRLSVGGGTVLEWSGYGFEDVLLGAVMQRGFSKRNGSVRERFKILKHLGDHAILFGGMEVSQIAITVGDGLVLAAVDWVGCSAEVIEAPQLPTNWVFEPPGHAHLMAGHDIALALTFGGTALTSETFTLTLSNALREVHAVGAGRAPVSTMQGAFSATLSGVFYYDGPGVFQSARIEQSGTMLLTIGPRQLYAARMHATSAGTVLSDVDLHQPIEFQCFEDDVYGTLMLDPFDTAPIPFLVGDGEVFLVSGDPYLVGRH